VTSYVIAEDTREDVNIEELNASINEIVERQSSLRHKIDKIVAILESGD
jgi:type I restriction enzyme M protein